MSVDCVLRTILCGSCTSFVAFIVVAELEAWPGVRSSADSDVFVCEEAVGTHGPESDAASRLPAGSSRRSRTQHGRSALGLEASVVYSDYENGMFAFLLFCTLCCLFLCSVVVCPFFGWVL